MCWPVESVLWAGRRRAEGGSLGNYQKSQGSVHREVLLTVPQETSVISSSCWVIFFPYLNHTAVLKNLGKTKLVFSRVLNMERGLELILFTFFFHFRDEENETKGNVTLTGCNNAEVPASL